MRILPMRPAAPITAIRCITCSLEPAWNFSRRHPAGWQQARTRSLQAATTHSEPDAKPPGTVRRIAGKTSEVAEEPLHALKPAAGLGRMRAVAFQRLAELFQQLALTFVEIDRRLHRHPAHQVASTATAHGRNALAAQTEQLAGLGALRNFQLDP